MSLPRNVAFEDVDEGLARALLALPRPLGDDPESGEAIEAGIGRFGPYVRLGRTYASIPKDEDVLRVTLERARELLAAKRSRSKVRRELGPHPETGDAVELRDGRYGPYVTHAKVNASLRDEHDPDTIDLDTALALLAEREAATGTGRRKTSRTTARSAAAARTAKGAKGSAPRKGAASAGAKAGAKGGRTKASGRGSSSSKRRPAAGRAASAPAGAAAERPKATTADLERHLGELDEPTREVVVRLEGMGGRSKRSVDEVAADLDLSDADVQRMRKSGLFRLRMAFGKAREADAGRS